MRPTHLVALALLIGLVAAAPRLADLEQPSLNTDEVKWIHRGARLVRLAREGHPQLATAHLGHPGVPAAAAIGVTEIVAQHLGGGLDPVVAGRLSSALVGSALPALTFFAAAPVWGPEAAALAALLLAFEPRHLATCRTAHIDLFFSLFYLTALWAGWRHLETGRPGFAAAAAISLGLAQATRTSGVLALVTMAVFALLLWFRDRRCVLRVAHLYWGALALAVFLLVFGKLWLPPASIAALERYHAPAWIASVVGRVDALPLVLPLLGAALAAGLGWRRRERLAGAALLGAAVALAAAALVPDLVNNLSGYALNVLHSRSRLHHRYYGATLGPPPGKYATVLATGMPLLTLLPALAGFVLLVRDSWRGRDERSRFGLLLIVALVCFLGFASLLAKVAFRYLMPIYPLLDLAAAYGFWRAAGRLPPLARRAALAAVAAAMAVIVWPAQPNYSAWESVLGRQIRSALDLPAPLAAEGHEEAARYLWEHAASSSRVLVLCYDDVLRYYWTEVLPHRLGAPPKPMPRFGFFHADESDFIVVSARRRRGLPRDVEAFLAARAPEMRVVVNGEVAMEVYEVRRG